MSRRLAACCLACALSFGWIVAPAAETAPRVLAWDSFVPVPDDNPLRRPVAVAAASAEEIVVADAEPDRLVVFRQKTPSVWSVDGELHLDGTPHSLAHDGTRYAVSLRDGKGLFGVEGRDLRLRSIALPTGTAPGALAGIPGGGFFVYDFASQDVLRLDEAGASAGRASVDAHVTGLTAASDGGFLALIAHQAELRHYGADGSLRDRWSIPGKRPVPAWPTGIVADSSGDRLIVDRHNHRLLVLNAGGRLEGIGSRSGWEPGLVRFPVALALLPDDRIAVVDQGNGRLQLFRRSEVDSP